MADQPQPLILLAALAQLLLQEIERGDYPELATDRLKDDLRAFAARVESELDASTSRRRLQLARPEDSGVPDH